MPSIIVHVATVGIRIQVFESRPAPKSRRFYSCRVPGGGGGERGGGGWWIEPSDGAAGSTGTGTGTGRKAFLQLYSDPTSRLYTRILLH